MLVFRGVDGIVQCFKYAQLCLVILCYTTFIVLYILYSRFALVTGSFKDACNLFACKPFHGVWVVFFLWNLSYSWPKWKVMTMIPSSRSMVFSNGFTYWLKLTNQPFMDRQKKPCNHGSVMNRISTVRFSTESRSQFLWGRGTMLR